MRADLFCERETRGPGIGVGFLSGIARGRAGIGRMGLAGRVTMQDKGVVSSSATATARMPMIQKSSLRRARVRATSRSTSSSRRNPFGVQAWSQANAIQNGKPMQAATRNQRVAQCGTEL